MKKLKLLGIVIFVLVVISAHPFHVQATSGACSYHGGVDCSAGAAGDGSAICNDGSESSVQYDDMEECAGYSSNLDSDTSSTPDYSDPVSSPTGGSGACSDHGGVDCSVGAGVYGQAICNDGWDGSSVLYSQVDECQSSSSSSDSICGAYSQTQYDEITNNLNEMISESESTSKSNCDSNLAQEQATADQTYQDCMSQTNELLAQNLMSGNGASTNARSIMNAGVISCGNPKTQSYAEAQNEYNECIEQGDEQTLNYKIELACVTLAPTPSTIVVPAPVTPVPTLQTPAPPVVIPPPVSTSSVVTPVVSSPTSAVAPVAPVVELPVKSAPIVVSKPVTRTILSNSQPISISNTAKPTTATPVTAPPSFLQRIATFFAKLKFW